MSTTKPKRTYNIRIDEDTYKSICVHVKFAKKTDPKASIISVLREEFVEA